MAIYKLVSDYLLKCLQKAVKAIQCSIGKPNGIATLDSTGNVPASQLANAGGGGGAVSSVFTRTGAITAQSGDYTFAQIGSKPTTLAGYGITNGQTTVTLTTTGTSGAATFIGSTLNVPQYAASTPSVQYMWVVGGANNFSTLPGSPTPPIAGATTLVDVSLTGFNVRVVRGGLPLLGINPGDGTIFYTKVKASNTLTFSSALVAGESIIVETIPL